uniref:Uncharacterized protein n=1 Tax=Knipowitschia caucasica TaxID=637954 RepID=A0AAV2KUC9_KNICA
MQWTFNPRTPGAWPECVERRRGPLRHWQPWPRVVYDKCHVQVGLRSLFSAERARADVGDWGAPAVSLPCQLRQTAAPGSALDATELHPSHQQRRQRRTVKARGHTDTHTAAGRSSAGAHR